MSLWIDEYIFFKYINHKSVLLLWIFVICMSILYCPSSVCISGYSWEVDLNQAYCEQLCNQWSQKIKRTFQSAYVVNFIPPKASRTTIYVTFLTTKCDKFGTVNWRAPPASLKRRITVPSPTNTSLSPEIHCNIPEKRSITEVGSLSVRPVSTLAAFLRHPPCNFLSNSTLKANPKIK